MSSRRRPLVPVFLWASIYSFMYGRFCFHHTGLVWTKGRKDYSGSQTQFYALCGFAVRICGTISQNLRGIEQKLMRIATMCGNSSHAPILDTNLHPVLAKIDCDTLVAIRGSRVLLDRLQKKESLFVVYSKNCRLHSWVKFSWSLISQWWSAPYLKKLQLF